MVEALRTDYSVRQICETLGFTRSTLYYQPKQDPCEEVLPEEIETLARRYPKYGYRRITQLLLRMGYTVGYKRVARLMKPPISRSQSKVSVKPRSPLTVCVPGSIALKTLRSLDAIRSGWAILLMSDSRRVSSMFLCSWMSSLA